MAANPILQEEAWRADRGYETNLRRLRRTRTMERQETKMRFGRPPARRLQSGHSLCLLAPARKSGNLPDGESPAEAGLYDARHRTKIHQHEIKRERDQAVAFLH